MPTEPLYPEFSGSEDPLKLMASTPQRIAALVRGWDSGRWSRSYAPGKWTAAQIVLHLAHDEIAWCDRVRYALTLKDFVIQAFDGDAWVAMETPTEAAVALDAYLALRRLNLLLYRRIPADARARPLAHPLLGEISVDWILKTVAGHDLHHLAQLEAIAAL